ncbi:hypothetical protein [Comamonas flocculans]|uniref:Uncharacterized protein n=1 Tax=Comamonas flocculans TaxID=2597701 RepID=A0A5B8RQF2_9BURK|nr:hypothetical protein [Comamonas flocculans]QEA11850.1 hypothetical protein FOZ74_01690 [Comamonas flocculans]
MPTRRRFHRTAAPARWALVASGLLSLAGCDIPGLGPDPRELARSAEAQAIGGACRFAMRGLEDCYTLNPKAAKAQIFAGWKEMDQYMRENKVEAVPSVLTQTGKPAARSDDADEDDAPARSGARSRG